MTSDLPTTSPPDPPDAEDPARPAWAAHLRDRATWAALRARAAAALPEHVPIVAWLPAYPRDNLRFDLIAGVTVWGVGIPTAMAYAQLAGVPAQAGLYSAFAALLLYSLFATSRHVKVTASSTMAVMSAAVIAPLAAGDAERYWALTAALAITVGICLVAAGILHLGFIADFLSKPVVTGFVFGLAIVVTVGQLPKLFGLPGGSGNVFQQAAQLIRALPETNLYTLAVGLGALGVILAVRRFVPGVPAGLVALVAGIAVSMLFDLAEHGVSVVGAIPIGLPAFGVPAVGLSDLPVLLAGAAGIVFLAVGESLGSARAFASLYRYDIDADQELVAIGAANLGSGLSQGMTVDVSLSASATADAAGTRSQLTSLVASGLVLATAVFLAPLFRPLPNAVLGAIVIAAVTSLMDVGELRRYWAWRRSDFTLALVALFGVISSDVLTGLAIAIVLSLVMVLRRASWPDIVVLGTVPGQSGAYEDIARHPEYPQVPGLVIFRVDAQMFFANTNIAQTVIRDHVAAADPPPRAIVIDLGASADLDVMSLDTLRVLVEDLRARGIDTLFAQIRGPARDRLRRTGVMDVIGEERVFLSVEAAVRAFEAGERGVDVASTAGHQPPPAQIPQDDRTDNTAR